MPRLLHRCDVAVGAFVVQVCIKVVSCWLLGEMAWAIPVERVFDWWMVAETEVSPRRLFRLWVRILNESANTRLHPMVQTWKICWDMLGKDWDMLGKCLICCKLSMCCRCCNIRRRSIRCVMPDIDSLWILFWCSQMMMALPKMPSSKFGGGMQIMELYPLSWPKRVSQRKKYRTFEF